MKNEFSIFHLKQLEADLKNAYKRLDSKIEAHAKLSNELDSLATYIEVLRHEISIRNMNRKQWNGAPVRMEIVD